MKASRTLRVLSSKDQAELRASPEGADQAGCTLVDMPFQPTQLRHYPESTAHWRWPVGPGGLPPSELAPSQSAAAATGTEAVPRDSGPWPQRVTPSVTSTTVGFTPAALTPQEPPYGAGLPPRISALMPPTRSTEPWTTEEWVLVYDQPGSYSDSIVASLWTGSHGRYWGDARYGEDPRPWMPLPVGGKRKVHYSWSGDSVGMGAQALYSDNVPKVFRATATMNLPVVLCPRQVLSEACTPMDVPIAPNDTCRQATAWQAPPNASRNECRVDPGRPELASLGSFENDYQSVVRSQLVHTTMAIPSPGGTKEYPFSSGGAGLYNRWHQVLTVVYPPGTVAQLDTIPPSAARNSRDQYPWHVNTHHVVQAIWSLPPMAIEPGQKGSSLYDTYVDASSGYLYCRGLNLTTGFEERSHGIFGQVVVLDDPSCVEARTCSPNLPINSTSTRAERNRLLRRWTRDVLQALPLGAQMPKIGCALTMEVQLAKESASVSDSGDQFVTDVVHSDYPAASSTRAASIGGMLSVSVSEGTRGAWPNATVGPMDILPSNAGTRPPVPAPAPQAGKPWPPLLNPIPLQGPKARYRGAALWRVTADAPPRSLPGITRGRWTCGETSPIGAFFMRPVCRMECDDPGRIAVDLGLEGGQSAKGWEAVDLGLEGGKSAKGWEAVASLARPWLSTWGGHPSLVQSDSVVPRSGQLGPGLVGSFGSWKKGKGFSWHPPTYYKKATRELSPTANPPNVRCMRDKGGLLPWSDSLWAQREPTAAATVSFMILFDRNQWPPAYTTVAGQPNGPGLGYPSPTVQYVDRLQAELQADVMDLLGEWDPSLKARQEGAEDALGPDWEAWALGLEPSMSRRKIIGGNESSLYTRVINVEVLSVRSPIPRTRVQPSQGTARPISPNPPQEPPYLPMEIYVTVRLEPIPVVLFGSDGWRKAYRGRSAGALAQQLGAILRGKRPGAEGGAWLPATVPMSVDVSVELPCLHGGMGRNADECNDGLGQALWGPVAIVQWLLLVGCMVGTGSICAARAARKEGRSSADVALREGLLADYGQSAEDYRWHGNALAETSVTLPLAGLPSARWGRAPIPVGLSIDRSIEATPRPVFCRPAGTRLHIGSNKIDESQSQADKTTTSSRDRDSGGVSAHFNSDHLDTSRTSGSSARVNNSVPQSSASRHGTASKAGSERGQGSHDRPASATSLASLAAGSVGSGAMSMRASDVIVVPSIQGDDAYTSGQSGPSSTHLAQPTEPSPVQHRDDVHGDGLGVHSLDGTASYGERDDATVPASGVISRRGWRSEALEHNPIGLRGQGHAMVQQGGHGWAQENLLRSRTSEPSWNTTTSRVASSSDAPSTEQDSREAPQVQPAVGAHSYSEAGNVLDGPSTVSDVAAGVGAVAAARSVAAAPRAVQPLVNMPSDLQAVTGGESRTDRSDKEVAAGSKPSAPARKEVQSGEEQIHWTDPDRWAIPDADQHLRAEQASEHTSSALREGTLRNYQSIKGTCCSQCSLAVPHTAGSSRAMGGTFAVFVLYRAGAYWLLGVALAAGRMHLPAAGVFAAMSTVLLVRVLLLVQSPCCSCVQSHGDVLRLGTDKEDWYADTGWARCWFRVCPCSATAGTHDGRMGQYLGLRQQGSCKVFTSSMNRVRSKSIEGFDQGSLVHSTGGHSVQGASVGGRRLSDSARVAAHDMDDAPWRLRDFGRYTESRDDGPLDQAKQCEPDARLASLASAGTRYMTTDQYNGLAYLTATSNFLDSAYNSSDQESDPIHVVRRAARSVASTIGMYPATAVVLRALQALQWDAYTLMWSGVSDATDPRMGHLLSSSSLGATGEEEMSRRGRALHSFVNAMSWWQRLWEDVAVLVCVGWALLCVVGTCGHAFCMSATPSGTYSRGDLLVRGTNPSLYWEERLGEAGLSIGVAVLLAAGSICVSAFLAWGRT